MSTEIDRSIEATKQQYKERVHSPATRYHPSQKHLGTHDWKEK